MFIFYLAGYFYFKNIDKKHFRIEKEIELLVKIKKVEPYYSGYLNTAFSSSVGDFVFKTDKKYFSPGETCLITFKNRKNFEYFNPFSVEKKRLLLTKGIDAELIIQKEKDFVCERDDFF